MILVRVYEGDSVSVHRLEVFPAGLGRSMHCALRIDDPSVSAHHAELHEREDGYVLRDLASTNGVYQGGVRISEVKLKASDSLILGNVRVDFISEDPPEKTLAKKLLPSHSVYSSGTPLRIASALLAAFTSLSLVAASDQYQVFWPPERPTEMIGKALMLWAAVAAAALLVSMFCKLNAKRFYFHQVLLLMAAAAVAAKTCMVLTPTVTFNLRWMPLASHLRPIGYGIISFWFSFLVQRYLFYHFTVAQRALVAAVALVLTMAAAHIFLERPHGDRQTMAQIGFDLRPELGLKANGEDLFFDLALSVAAVDQQRIKMLEAIEEDRSGD